MAHAAAAAALALLVFLCAQARDAGVHAAAVTLSQGQSLGATDKLVSAGGTFELAFFTPTGAGDPSRRYLGIMYAQSAEQTVPWVANRDAPVSAGSAYSATVTAAGELQVLEEGRVVWRTNSATPASSSSAANVTLTLLDTGNLQLTAGATVIWRSFDYPTDTFLPGMSIILERRDGAAVRRTLFTSWRSPGDPGTGDFTLGQDPLGSAQLYIWRTGGGNNNSTYWRSGQWANTNFVGVPWRSLYVYGFKLNGDPYNGSGVMYYVFNTYNSSEYRFMLHSNGTETCYMLLDTGEWETVWSEPTIPCQDYNMCGANAGCASGGDDGQQAICTCLTGFEPRNVSEYSNGNWTQGCVRSSPLTCETNSSGGGDGFADLPGVKLPNFAAWGSTVGDADACKQSCLANCSCGAYSYSNNTSCLTWGQDLLDIYQFPDGEGYDLQIKVPAYLLETGSKRRRWTTVVVAVVIVVVVLAGCGLLLWKCRRRIKEKLGIVGREKTKTTQPSLLPLREARQDFSGPKQPDQEEAEGGKKCELPLFSFETVAAATGDFGADNKLGEGGFGHVYKLWNADKGERLIDPAILPACPVRDALRCVHMALLCVQDHACDRPDIPYVVMALGSDSSVLPMPKPPTFTLQCTSSDKDGIFPDRVDESYSACDLTVTMLQGR
ncbi:unnamed protein product [Miscanthus lutarioriparius]|uniref:non-specific serine/threonine protein kinase n=1 Tax=Miscanthus lutarioriparius TaxID=422564 RepID=A0A811N3D4_9POAL|nr:unnamed protein product [Miscanthus lutarioriparius]